MVVRHGGLEGVILGYNLYCDWSNVWMVDTLYIVYENQQSGENFIKYYDWVVWEPFFVPTKGIKLLLFGSIKNDMMIENSW